MTILSQLDSVDPIFLSNFAILALVVVGALVGAATLWNAVRNRPPNETPTRREFDDLKGKVTHIENTLPQMELRILDGVREATKDLTLKIEDIAKTDHEERAEIWEKFHDANKDIGERVARVESGKKP